MVNQEQSNRLLTVKGIGRISTKPDLTIITLELSTITPEYEKTMEKATNEIESIRKALISIGYKQQDLKTTDFNISTEYEFYYDAQGNHKQRFQGYECKHSLKLEIDFDMKRLGETLTTISSCGATPTFNISFSVKDKNAVSAELLDNAIINAKEKAAILAKAAGVHLGAIQNINYSWGELQLYSRAEYRVCEKTFSFDAAQMDIEPDDINASDSVTVIWNIE